MWDGAALYGKSILLVAEQGLGDSIQFIRYAAWLKQRYNCRTLFACQPALRQLLSTCEGIDVWIDNERDPAGYDVFSPLVHVPGALGHTTHDFPSAPHYLSAARRWLNSGARSWQVFQAAELASRGEEVRVWSQPKRATFRCLNWQSWRSFQASSSSACKRAPVPERQVPSRK